VGRPRFAPHAIGKTGRVHSRTPLLARLCSGLLAVGLAVGAVVVVGRVALDPGREASAIPAATRVDAVDVPGPGALGRPRDRLESERDARRLDVATLTAALVMAAVACWWIARDRKITHVDSLRPIATRPRAPPAPPALVCT
jgi:hypothetical protein